MTAGEDPPDAIAKVIVAAVAFAEAIRELVVAPIPPPRLPDPPSPRIQRIDLDAGD